jgi:hypothetical protein
MSDVPETCLTPPDLRDLHPLLAGYENADVVLKGGNPRVDAT